MNDLDPFKTEPTQAELVALGRRTMARNFRQQPIVLVRGEGMYLWDREGRRYIDFVGGIAVCGLGHAHPVLTDAIVRQARQLVHISNLWFNEPQILLSAALSERYGGGRVFLANSGAEANEAALKLARRYASKVKGEPARNRFVSFHQSFHGRTLGALAATGQPKYHEGFEPMIEGFDYATFNDLASVEALVTDATCAVIVEPIQAEGGLIVAEPGFLAEVGRICRERGALLILDEVQVGCGRTGTFFAYEQEDVLPDIVTLAKALGGGLPVGAMISSDEVSHGFQPGSHGSTFSGNPVACRAAVAFLQVIEEDALLQHVALNGAWFSDELDALAGRFDCVDGCRGRGFIQGLGLNRDWAPSIVALCQERGLLVNKLGTRTLRFLPPLICERSHIRAAIEILSDVLGEIESNPPEG